MSLRSTDAVVSGLKQLGFRKVVIPASRGLDRSRTVRVVAS